MAPHFANFLLLLHYIMLMDFCNLLCWRGGLSFMHVFGILMCKNAQFLVDSSNSGSKYLNKKINKTSSSLGKILSLLTL